LADDFARFSMPSWLLSARDLWLSSLYPNYAYDTLRALESLNLKGAGMQQMLWQYIMPMRSVALPAIQVLRFE